VVEEVPRAQHQVQEILELLVVLVVVELDFHLPAVHLLAHHSQELLEQHHLLDGDIQEEVHLVLKVLVEVVALVEQVVMILVMVRVASVFNFHQHLEILHL
jgi:hypothetical protein